MASVDYEHHLNIRLFKWAAEMSIEKPDDKRMQAHRVILFRASIVGATATEVIAMPFSTPDLEGPGLLGVLHETLKRLHLLSSLKNPEWIAYHLLLREICLKFGHSLARHSDDVLVMFFDLKINQASRMIACPRESREDKIKKVCSKRLPHISSFQVNAEINLEKVEEIKECLKACPGMVVENSRGMEEVKSYVEIGVLNGSEEDDAECPICLVRMRVGYRHATTCCGHKFHKVCMTNWLLKRKKSCPMCRYSLYISE